MCDAFWSGLCVIKIAYHCVGAFESSSGWLMLGRRVRVIDQHLTYVLVEKLFWTVTISYVRSDSNSCLW
jgi:hypothetical protein